MHILTPYIQSRCHTHIRTPYFLRSRRTPPALASSSSPHTLLTPYIQSSCHTHIRTPYFLRSRQTPSALASNSSPHTFSHPTSQGAVTHIFSHPTYRGAAKRRLHLRRAVPCKICSSWAVFFWFFWSVSEVQFGTWRMILVGKILQYSRRFCSSCVVL